MTVARASAPVRAAGQSASDGGSGRRPTRSSRTARLADSKDSGGGTFYDKVYEADRPELFFKATPHRVAAPGTGMEMRFSGIAGRSYSVQFTEAIGTGWTELTRLTAQSGSGFLDYTHANPPPGNGFYRCLPAN